MLERRYAIKEGGKVVKVGPGFAAPSSAIERPPFQAWLADDADTRLTHAIELIRTLESLKEDQDPELTEASRLAVISLLESLLNALLMKNLVREYIERLFRTLLDPDRQDFGECALAQLRKAFWLRRDFAVNAVEDQHIVNYEIAKREVVAVWASWDGFVERFLDFISTGQAAFEEALDHAEDATRTWEVVLADRGLPEEMWAHVEIGGPASGALDRIYLKDGLELIHEGISRARERVELPRKVARRITVPELLATLDVAKLPVRNATVRESRHCQIAQAEVVGALNEAVAIALEFTDEGGSSVTTVPDPTLPVSARYPNTTWIVIDGERVLVYLDENGEVLVGEDGEPVLAAGSPGDLEEDEDDDEDDDTTEDEDEDEDTTGEDTTGEDTDEGPGTGRTRGPH